MKKILTVRNILIAIPAVILIAALHYSLPQVDVVRAVGVEVKRVDVSEGNADKTRTRDVYQLQMETLDGSPRVYRNEDNILYGKFASADLQTQVRSLAADKQLVALRHYGWRLRLFSTFPNAVKVWPVEEGYRHIPFFNIVFLTFVGFLIFMLIRRIRRVFKRRDEKRRSLEAEREAEALREEQASAKSHRDSEKQYQDEIDKFLNTDDDN
ncbi:DUF1523 family protein [Vreelandella subglaciescola]|jgi:hypothetical protein|uniref:DUF1523 domain-containing protein n=1 Tax=Vreelandella subglaciescola TaxID=29571 RepID=A0A1M7FPK8_9GAMM|nr:DUF1523 family protein [Halomonas subglaciescola]SHM05905.1 Protein of unknown function [Halomonas subglaciescola]